MNNNFRVVAIDDEQDFLSSLMTLLEVAGYQVQTFTSVEAAIEGIAKDDTLFITLLDHDFSFNANVGKFGYEFSKFLKRNHWAKSVMPIIYLTGRESKEGFTAAVSEFGGFAPDEYLAKSDLAINTQVLLERVNFYQTRLSNFEASVEEHGREVAVGNYTDWSD